MHCVSSQQSYKLFNVESTRQLEQLAASALPPHTLMQRAGSQVARLALALAPHARTVWIACGPGNNGGDGLEAATHLQRGGKSVVVTWLGSESGVPPDARASLQRARDAGANFADTPPTGLGAHDLCIDALLGIGNRRALQGRMLELTMHMNTCATPVLSIDLPSGLDADTGQAFEPEGASPQAGGNLSRGITVQAQHTLSLLTLKPGLFTGHGRDATGQLWFSNLEVDDAPVTATAVLTGVPSRTQRPHASHKGSYGDVTIVGGASGMTGAALLAASAALRGGAGRVYVALLDPAAMTVDASRPELMFCPINSLNLEATTLVCGCGGGDAVRSELPRVLATPSALVLDADALNALARDRQLQTLLSHRGQRGRATVLTPHPLEAARLLESTVSQIQANRLSAAQKLADRFTCTVVLKGSGTVIADVNHAPAINPTGNARLATAGTGDVLAGLIGARLASGSEAFRAACEAVFEHGQFADEWPVGASLVAGQLAS